MNREALEQVFTRVPLLQRYSPGDFSITPLPGYTNTNFRLQKNEIDWVLRVTRPETDRFIDRGAEAANQSLANQLDIAPQVVWRDESGLSLTPTLSASRNIRPADFTSVTTLQAILAPIRKLHRSGLSFAGEVDLEQLLQRYYSMLDESQRQSYSTRFQQAQSLLAGLAARDCGFVASHNDLVLENLLLEQDWVWLIDWEFSAMASPYWDLATLCNAARLDQTRSLEVLQLYNTDRKKLDASLLFDYRSLLQLLSDCWMTALVKTPAEPQC